MWRCLRSTGLLQEEDSALVGLQCPWLPSERDDEWSPLPHHDVYDVNLFLIWSSAVLLAGVPAAEGGTDGGQVSWILLLVVFCL